MAISRVTSQDCTATNGSTASVTAHYAVTPAVGNLLVACASLAANSSNVTIPAGWTSLVNHQIGGGFSVHLAYKVAGGSESTSVTFSQTGGTLGVTMAAYEYAGADTSTPGDKNANNLNFSAATSLATGTTATISQADELIFTVIATSSNYTSPSWANATLITNMGNLFTGQRIVSSVAAYTDTGSWTGSVVPIALIGTFRAAIVVNTTAYWTIAQ